MPDSTPAVASDSPPRHRRIGLRFAIAFHNALRAGYSQRVEWPTNGKDVWRTVTVRENGKVIRRTTYYSHYSVVTGVVLIGTGGPSAPTSVP